MPDRKFGPIRRALLRIEIYDVETHGVFLMLLSVSILMGAIFGAFGLTAAIAAMMVFTTFYINRRDAPASAELLEALLDFIGPDNADDLREYWTDWIDVVPSDVLSRKDSIYGYRYIDNKVGPRARKRNARLKTAQDDQERVLK